MIRVPTKSYLRKFLIGKINQEKIELKKITPAEIAKEKDLTRAVQLQYMKKIADMFLVVGLFKTHQSYRDTHPDDKLLNDFIGVELSENMLRKKYIYIDMVGVRHLNKKLYEWFAYDVQMHCDFYKSNGGKLQDGLMDYMSHYDLEFEDIKFETLQKCYYRNRQRSKKNTANKSLTTGLFIDLSISEKLKK